MKKTFVFFLAIFIQFTVSAQSTNKTARLVTREESLGKLLPGAEPNTLTVDANFQHVAYVVKRGEKELAVVDGVDGKEYDNISDHRNMLFSPDGKRFAYVAKRGKKTLVVADGKEGKEYDHINWSPIFSPDSKRLAYIATIEDSLKEQQGIWSLKDFIVEDGAEGKSYELAEAPIFSPDSKKLAFEAEPHWNQGACVVVNGIEGKQYSGISGVLFSPDSSRLAYAASKRNPDRSLAIIDGKEGKEYEGSVSSVGGIFFSPDSKHTAYRVLRRKTTTATTFSQDTKHTAHKVDLPQNYIVLDDVPQKSYDATGGFPVFSPDSKRLAYAALQGANWMLVADDKVFDDRNTFEYSHIPVFSPDSQHLAYMSLIGTNWFAVVDGVVEKQSKTIWPDPVFSPDSKRLIYLKQHGEKFIPFFGELDGKEYDQFLTCNPFLNTMGVMGRRDVVFAFDERKIIHAIALQGDEILRLEFEIVGE
jgi:Tol biopolymer transport system component